MLPDPIIMQIEMKVSFESICPTLSPGFHMQLSDVPFSYAFIYAAKSVNRLSSDTDNETDRLLGSQRNDQLQKMNNSELNSNSSASDRQNANNFAGRQSNSREGKELTQ